MLLRTKLGALAQPSYRPLTFNNLLKFQKQCLSTSSAATTFVAQVSSHPFQIYISKLDDPYLNLSLEHYLLQKSPKHSTNLFLYTNRPSIVIGRNQNPWLEVDLKRLKTPHGLQTWSANGNKIPAHVPAIDLVRRRSGGGTVFHDPGNVNYCVISPNASFTRDKHAEMVVRALRNGINPRARVNERHDIVLDRGEEESPRADVDPEDMHRTRYEDPRKQPFKVSGSAYKMVRDRTLHHGTCLVNSANLGGISGFLRAPAAAHVKALGVDSVRTPVANVLSGWSPMGVQRFQAGVIEQFLEMYDVATGTSGAQESRDERDDGLALMELREEHADLPEIRKGVEELRSEAWIYGQTPRFTFSSEPHPGTEAVPWRSRYPKPDVQMATRSSVIEEATVDGVVQDKLIGRKIHELDGFGSYLTVNGSQSSTTGKDDELGRALGAWLDDVFAIKHK